MPVPVPGWKFKEWLKTLRKKNVSVVFSSQSLADIEASPIAPVIVESCPTRIFLANERAIEPQIASVYRQFGLNDRQIEIIARATPKRDYYCQAARMQPVRDGFINAVQVYPFSPGALYQVYAAPGQVTDIALQPGETLVGSGPVAAGDTVRWIIGDTESGAGDRKQVHIFVEPTRPDLQTNLVINTDRRTYHIELRSTEKTYMASVSWQYPHDQLIALRRQNARAVQAQPVATGVDISRLNFRYRIEGDTAPWRPLRAFDDGAKVYIEFPSGIAQGEMPPLFVIGASGNSELVNYRARQNYYVVDRLFAAAELRLGDKDTQKRVRIVRTEGRPVARRTALFASGSGR